MRDQISVLSCGLYCYVAFCAYGYSPTSNSFLFIFLWQTQVDAGTEHPGSNINHTRMNDLADAAAEAQRGTKKENILLWEVEISATIYNLRQDYSDQIFKVWQATKVLA